MGQVRPYGVPIQQAIARGDLQEMKYLQEATESYLREQGDVAAALEVLKLEIAKLEKKS